MFRLAALSYRISKLIIAKVFHGPDKFLDDLIIFVKDYGGLYVKFVQLLSLQTTLFSNNQSTKLMTFYDNVGVEKLDIHKFLQRELGSKYSKLAQVESQPFASGAFAQVYKGVLQDGTKVIFKVKKRGLKAKLYIDFMLLHAFIYVLDIIYTIPLFNPHKLFQEFKNNVMRELDYVEEVKNALIMYGYYKNHLVAKVPFTFKELSTKNLIVQELVEGLAMTKLIIAKHNSIEEFNQLVYDYGIDVEPLLRHLTYELSTQSARFDKFFGDPHPGNIILLGGNRYAFIDFGVLDDIRFDKANYYKIISFIVKLKQTSDFSSVTSELLKFGAEDLYQALFVLDSAFRSKKPGELGVLDTLSSDYKDLLVNKTGDFMVLIRNKGSGALSHVFFEMVKMGNKFNITIPTMLFNIVRSSSMFSSYIDHLTPGVDIMAKIYDDMLEEFSVYNLDVSNPSTDIELSYAVEYVMNWLSGLAERDAYTFSRISRAIKEVSNV